MIDYKISRDPIPIILVENFLVPSEKDKKNILINIYEDPLIIINTIMPFMIRLFYLIIL
mgnify:CR=1 FL=1